MCNKAKWNTKLSETTAISYAIKLIEAKLIEAKVKCYATKLIKAIIIIIVIVMQQN